MSQKPLYRVEFPKKRLKSTVQDLRRIYLAERQVFSEMGFEFQVTRLLKLDPEKHKYGFVSGEETVEFHLDILLTRFKVLAFFDKKSGTCSAIYGSIEEHI